MTQNYILGSGLVALICRKILGDTWRIIPLGPSKSYSEGVPAWGDDFIVYDDSVADVVKQMGFNTVPIFFKRPLSYGGQLMYNNVFLEQFLDRVGLEITPLTKDLFKSDISVFPFSCIQLWNNLLPQFIGEIRGFFSDINAKGIAGIKDHIISLKTDTGIKNLEYQNIISTVPNFVLSDMLGIPDDNRYGDLYYYYIESDINIDNADQVLVCDSVIPFHRCTRISGKRFLIEVLDQYHEKPLSVFQPVFGNDVDFIKARLLSKGYPYPGQIDNKTHADNSIIAIGSLAQCDPLMDMSSCIKRIINQSNKGKIGTGA